MTTYHEYFIHWTMTTYHEYFIHWTMTTYHEYFVHWTMTLLSLYPFPNYKILGWSKLKVFADDKCHSKIEI